MEENQIQVFDNKQKRLFKAPLSKNSTFKINLNAAAIQCFSTVNVVEKNWLWHDRYGHLNFKSLNQLNSKKMVDGMPIIKIPKKIYEGYMVGKQPRKKFQNQHIKELNSHWEWYILMYVDPLICRLSEVIDIF